jgi:hypothetical protein
MKSLKPSILATMLILCVALITSCTKDTDGENWSPTQALPPDTTANNNNNNPIDTNQVQSYPFNMQAILIGDQSFLGDSTTYQYTYDTLTTMHEFSCNDVYGRQLILRLPDLNLGDHPISFSTSTTITLIDDTVVFDTGFNPNGYVNIYSNSNGRISALFESDMTDIGGTGQIKELVNGLLENASFE